MMLCIKISILEMFRYRYIPEYSCLAYPELATYDEVQFIMIAELIPGLRTNTLFSIAI